MPTATPVDTNPTGSGGTTGTGTTGGTASAIPPGHASPTFGIALWNADLSRSRWLPLSIIAPSVSAHVTATEGYSEASFAVWGSVTDDALVGLVPRRRVEFWAAYKDDAGVAYQERLYSGNIKRIYPKKETDGRNSIGVTLYGVWADASNCPTMKRYANPAQVDKATWFADLVARFVQTRFPALIPDVLPVGDISDTLDAYNTTFGQAAQTLAQNTAKVVMGGSRLSADRFAPDTLVFRPFETPSVTPHVIDFSSKQVGVNKGDEQDDAKRATELKINGGLAKYGNILEQSLNGGSTSFEYPIIPGADGAGNLAQNPGFENGDKTNPTSWALHNSAIREQSDDGIAPFSGNRYLRLNGVNQDAFQLLIPEEALVPGRAYVLDCRVRLGSPSYPASGELRYQWRNSAGAYFGSTFSFPINPTGTIYDLFGGTVIPPDGAVALSIAPTCTVSSSSLNALIVDEVRFFDATEVQQKGWEFVSDQANGAYAKAIRWDNDTDFWHGARCVYLDVVAADSDGQNARIRPTNLARFRVDGGARLVCGASVKLPPGSPSMIVRPELYEWHNGGVYQGKTETGQITLTSTDWTLITTDRQYQSDAEEGSFAIQFRSAGQILIDGCFVMAYGAPLPDPLKPEQFIEGENFQTTLYAKDLFAPGTDVYNAYLEVGDVPETEDHPEITTQADAETYGLDYFPYYAVVIDRPTVETFGVLSTGRGTTASIWPGEMVKGFGRDDQNVLPVAKPLMEKEIRWDGKLSITLSCNAMKKNPARTLVEIARKVLRPYLSQITTTSGGSVGRGITSSDSIGGVDDTSVSTS